MKNHQRGGIDIDLTKHILAVANVFRQWNQQSFSELLTGQRVGPKKPFDGSSNVGKNISWLLS
ncbi:hypothetical protein [Spiroplasma endosymbiont of Nebria brevicollis]|uniref:hypothetical protein n=1 Tax=Spiroplasma endosymbiont of Nebria brevicollis TaxID=3066284 RepID=UPI00313E2EFF